VKRAPAPDAGPAAASRIHDVAREAGVSTATVSRALRGLDRVSPQTRARVAAAAEALQYVPSPTAASLKSGKTGVIGVVVPFLTRWFFTNLMDGAEALLRQDGYHILVFTIGARGDQRTQVLDHQLLGKRLDGILVLSADLDPHEVALLAGLRVPIVTVGLDLPGCDRVGIDDVHVADTAMSHLIRLGHQRIAYVGGNPAEDVHIATAVNRLAGVTHALHRHGLRLDTRNASHGDWTVHGGVAFAELLFREQTLPTAVLAASDEMAIGVLYAARRRGLDVPHDLSVMGIDDHEMSFTHELTTVRQQVREQGWEAGRLLLDALYADGPPASRREVILGTELVERRSTAPPSAS
jgi:LacI family repressor for deo operon, udp, cdd, tsx, nupC, and nupG